ncbi:hypothetical protein MUA04_00725 [Enterobacteriaceae bacterium H11S18]|uniref:hypothetical protein n=1 Tax=Dryocola clanedunensis TaxID=2925396 RepID=UPI0022F11CCA|nr:hypothetical protein [Dryocola clanedunensis]MCT4708762.1 hypothetical protein [Dryocola clanedunensis]
MLVIHETDQFPLRKIMQLHHMLGHEIWRSKHFPPKQALSNSMIPYYSTKPQTTHSSLIPEAGKYYYIASGNKAVQVPVDFTPNASINPDEIVKKYGNNQVKYWNVKNICSRPFWKIG